MLLQPRAKTGGLDVGGGRTQGMSLACVLCLQPPLLPVHLESLHDGGLRALEDGIQGAQQRLEPETCTTDKVNCAMMHAYGQALSEFAVVDCPHSTST